MDNKKKRKKKILTVSVIVLLMAVLVSSVTSGKGDDYNKIVSFVCDGEYSSAAELIDGFDSGYKEAEKISKYISIRNDYENADEPSYESVLSDLNQLGTFEDQSLASECQLFESKVSSEFDEYSNSVTQAEKIDGHIAKINVKALSVGDRATVEKIRNEYDSAPTNVKKYVKNYKTLCTAEDRLKEIQGYADKAAEIDNMISKIGTVTLESKNELKKIQQAYNDLPEGAKAYVKKADDLAAAKKEYSSLVKAEKLRQASSEAAEAITTTETSSASSFNFGNNGNENDDSGDGGYAYSGSTVYWVSSGKVYHTSPDCPSLGRSSNIHSGSVAQSGKSRVCKICGNW